MFDNEVIIEKEDKELALSYIKKINAILDKYPYQSKQGNTVTTISRAKSFSKDAEKWISFLEVEGE